jgi:membrane-bound lytic murein transglycosylase B
VTGGPWHRLIPLTATLGALALIVAGASGISPRPAAATSPQLSAADTWPADGRLDIPPLPARFEPMPRHTPKAAPKPRPAAPPAAAYAPELAADGIPAIALQAYRKAEQRMSKVQPGCHQKWYFVAAIGRVESNHGRFAGARLLTDGTSDPKILGLRLDGSPGFATITDTDHGLYDGDLQYDRAVGPMQFIPSTWAGYASDGDGDGKTDPFNLFDAALGAATYLCNGHDLGTLEGQKAAIHNYNHSDEYVALVLAIATEYAHGVRVVTLPPDPGDGKLPTPPKGPQPPASVGPPKAGKPGQPTPPTSTPPSSTPPSSTPPTSTPPSDPPTSPSDPPTSPSDPPTSPSDPPTTPSDPPTTPDPPPTTSETPSGSATPTSSDTPPSTSAAPTTSEPPTTSGPADSPAATVTP